MKRNAMMQSAALLVAGLLAGCATGGTSSPAAGPATEPLGTMITGHAGCWEDRAASPTPDADPTTETIAIACNQVASDPRFVGTTTAVGHFTRDEGLRTSWGSATVDTADGGWNCDEFYMGSDHNTIGWREGVCVGLGASRYEGLTAYFHATTADGGSTWGFIAWIDEGE